MVQLFVPLAVPDPPVELDHVTCATPALSLAVPLTTIELAEVERVVNAGDKIVMEGGAVPVPAPDPEFDVGEDGEPGVGLSAGGLGACSVTVTLWVA